MHVLYSKSYDNFPFVNYYTIKIDKYLSPSPAAYNLLTTMSDECREQSGKSHMTNEFKDKSFSLPCQVKYNNCCNSIGD